MRNRSKKMAAGSSIRLQVCHSEERSDVGICWYCVGYRNMLPGDCRKVNCLEEAREATLGCALTGSQ